MKTFVIENNSAERNDEKPVWSFLPDSALCNAGKPFFIPEDSGTIEAFIAPVIKITRLGKSIASRFASRYYSLAAPALHFRDVSKRMELLSRGLPPDIAQAFDRSLILGDFSESTDLFRNIPLVLLKNGIKTAEWNNVSLPINIESIFPEISAANTLKIGDYLIPALSNGTPVGIGDTLELSLDSVTLLSVQIK